MPRYSENASKYHRKVGEILTTSSEFKHHKIFQEYPVKKVNPDWHSNRHRFDWVIADLFLVIEVHGEQHHKVSCFGGISKEQGEANLESNQFNDFNKKEAALSVGWRYLVINYWEVDSLTPEKLLAKIALLPIPTTGATITAVPQKKDSRKQEYLERSRQARKERYQQFKAWRREQKRKQTEESDES